jgi:hypothetical protein
VELYVWDHQIRRFYENDIVPPMKRSENMTSAVNVYSWRRGARLFVVAGYMSLGMLALPVTSQILAPARTHGVIWRHWYVAQNVSEFGSVRASLYSTVLDLWGFYEFGYGPPDSIKTEKLWTGQATDTFTWKTQNHWMSYVMECCI